MPTWETHKVGKTKDGKPVYGLTAGGLAATTVSDETPEGQFYITVSGFYVSAQQLLLNDVGTPHPFFPGMPGLAFRNDPYTGMGRNKSIIDPNARELFLTVSAIKFASFRMRNVGADRREIRFHFGGSGAGSGNLGDDDRFNNSANDIIFGGRGKITIPTGFYSKAFGEPVYTLAEGNNIKLTKTSAINGYTIAYTGEGFYGISVSETDGSPSYRGINGIRFLASDFYLQQNPGNTDTVIVNLKNSLTKINDSGGTVNVSASIMPSADATLDLGTSLQRFDEIFCRKIVAREGTASAAASGPTAGGSVFGNVTTAAGNQAEISTGSTASRGNFATGKSRVLLGSGSITSIQATGTGSFASGYALSFNNSGYALTSRIRATGAGSHALGYARSYYGHALVSSSSRGSFAFGSAEGRGLVNSQISASSYGAFAGGSTLAYGSGSYITASGKGAFAFGYSYNSSIIASANGAIQFGPGTNNTANSLQVGNAAVRLLSTGEINFNGPLNHDGTTAGFFSKAPVTQRPDCFYLAVPFTATTDAALAQISGTGDDANVNNNFAEVAAKINRIRDALRKLGLMSGG